jgi:hypothetical protein
MTEKKQRKTFPKLRACHTVGALIKQLQRLPPDLAVKSTFDDGVKPIVMWSMPEDTPSLHIEDNDGTWDDR